MSKDKQLENLKKDFNITFASEEGQRVLSYLCKMCGYHSSSLVINPTGEINMVSTAHNESRRSVYIAIRNMLRKDIYLKAEQKD